MESHFQPLFAHDSGVDAPRSVAPSPPCEAIDAGTRLRNHLTEHYDSLHKRLHRNLGCPDIARECLHEVWLRLGEVPRNSDIRSPNAYVMRMAKNLAVDRVRAQRPTVSWEEMVDSEDMQDPAAPPEQVVDARLALAELEQVWRQLPFWHRLVFFDLCIEELPLAVVAERYRFTVRRINLMQRQSMAFCLNHMRA